MTEQTGPAVSSAPPIPTYNLSTLLSVQASLASFLAGTSVLAIVLVVQQPVLHVPHSELLRGRVTVALVLAFYGCVLAAFTFAVVAGASAEDPHILTAQILAQGTFLTAGSYILWALVCLIVLFLPSRVAWISHFLFVGNTVLNTTWLVAALVSDESVTRRVGAGAHRGRVMAALPLIVAAAYIPLVLAVLLRLISPAFFATVPDAGFDAIVAVSFVLLAADSTGVLLVGSRKGSAYMEPAFAVPWIALHSVLLGFLIALLP